MILYDNHQLINKSMVLNLDLLGERRTQSWMVEEAQMQPFVTTHLLQ